MQYEQALQRTETLSSEADVKGVIAALYFIIFNAARFGVDDQVLSTELQQLGLPKESTDALCKSYKKSRSALVVHFKAQTMQRK